MKKPTHIRSADNQNVGINIFDQYITYRLLEMNIICNIITHLKINKLPIPEKQK